MDPVEQRPRRSQKSKAGPGLRARALGMLARRELSRLELARKLAQYSEDRDEIPALLDEFEQRGWLSDRRVMEQVTAYRRGRFGMRRIIHELRDKGIAEEVINAAMSALKDTEFDAARSVWRKKFGKPPQSATERARQLRFLQGRGFTMETALKITAENEFDESHAQ